MSHSKSGSRGKLAGERERRGARAALATLGLVGLVAAVAPTPATAGTFQVSQCNTVGLAPASPAALFSAAWSTSGAAGFTSGCTGNGGGLHVTYNNRRLAHNTTSNQDFHMPSAMANTTISSVRVAYTANQQSASANPAYWSIYASGSLLLQRNLLGGSDSSSGVLLTTPAGSRLLQVGTYCSPANGPGDCNWAGDAYVINGLTFNLEENVDPTGEATGALVGAGPQSGTKPLDITAADVDSGVRRLDVTLDGVAAGSSDLSADCRIDTFSPCPTNVTRSVDVDTTRVPDGTRLLRLIVTDLAGNTKTVNKGYVTVDNVPAPANSSVPTISGEKRVNRTLVGSAGSWSGAGLSYAYRWERYAAAGWENIPDATSSTYTTTVHELGMRLRLKVTATNPEGSTVAYSDATNPVVAPGPTDIDGDFDGDGLTNGIDPDDDGDGTSDVQDAAPFDPRVGAPDAAGAPRPVGAEPSFSTPNGQNASNAATLTARFSDNRSKTITTRYGRVRHVTGTLVAASGAPIGGAQLAVISETLAMGATPVSAGTVTTDPSGRFRFAIPIGASRRIQVAYKWFRESAQYTHTTTVTVNVVPRVTMKANRSRLRNRQSVSFAGKVAGAPRGARKVVELQARVGRAWQTFGTARLRANGTFTYRYRFTRTSRPTVYQFRASVKAERGWPFLTGQSRATKVAVRP